MFAVVEFNNKKKEYSVIPLLWLSDDKSSCMWPKNVKSEEQLQTMVENFSEPTPSWGSYGIKKIHVTTGNFNSRHKLLEF